MERSKIRAEAGAWAGGAAIGAVGGTLLGVLTSGVIGLGAGIVLGALSALSIRRGRGSRGWSDVDGESHVGEGSESDLRRPVTPYSGAPSARDLPVTPGSAGGAS